MIFRGPALLFRARESASFLPVPLPRAAAVSMLRGEVVGVDDVGVEVELVERVCAIDIGKSALVACVRAPHELLPGRRAQEVRELGTTRGALLGLADWLRCQQVELVAMEATSDYWKSVFYLLESQGLRCWLLNAKHVKNVPGRPKTDKLDAVWLAKVIERGMCRPSLVHPRPIRELRDLTRYRRSLVRERSREKQRLEKVLEDAQIRLDMVVASLHSVPGRAMLEAMIAGERDPHVLAEMAGGVMRRKIPQLEEALRGHFEDHHGFICATMLRRIDALAADIATLDAKIDELVAPHLDVIERLDEIPGVGARSAQELIAEIGVDMAVFATAAHLVSWAKFAPIDATSAGRRKTSSTGKGNPWLAATLGENSHRRRRRDPAPPGAFGLPTAGPIFESAADRADLSAFLSDR